MAPPPPPLYVITGASAGIGLHAALELACSGPKTVVLAARRPDALASAVAQAQAAGKDAGSSAAGLQLDLSDLQNVKAFAAQLVKQYPGQKVRRWPLALGGWLSFWWRGA